MISLILIGIFVIVYLLEIFLGMPFTSALWFDPATFPTHPWTAITSVFLHSPADPMHLLFNAFVLFMFGPILERKIKRNNFIILFLGAGIAGSITYYLSSYLNVMLGFSDSLVPALGASGAIYGVLGALAVLLPGMMIYVWFIPMRMRTAAMLFVAIELFGSFNAASGIASAGHLGGLLFGFIFAYYLKNKEKKQDNFYSTY
ncbi:MAG: rhomboid family intramembrane serine protease [Candidatus Micrarchaeia archaeon]